MLLFIVSQRLSCNLERTKVTVISLLKGVNHDTVGFLFMFAGMKFLDLTVVALELSFPEESYSYCLGMKKWSTFDFSDPCDPRKRPL